MYEAPPEYRVLDGADDGYLLIGDDYRVLWANLTLRRTLGAGESDPARIIHAFEEDSEFAAKILTALEGDDEIPGFECRLKDPEGRESWYICSGRRALSGRGWLLQFRKAPHRGDYEKIVEYTGTATILLEDDGTISVANTEFERLSGYSRTEIVGVKRLPDFIASGDERQRIMGYHALRRKDPEAAPKNYTFSFVDRSGNIHTVEATIGLIPGTHRSVMSLLDVTEKKRMEGALRESEERYRTLAESAPDIIFLISVEGDILYANSAGGHLLRTEPESLPGKNLKNLFPPAVAERWLMMLQRAVEMAEEITAEETLLPGDDGGTWLETRLIPMRESDGTVRNLLGISRNITDRKQAELELQIKDMAIASSQSGIALADLGGKIIYVNRSFLAMHGYEVEEIVGKPIAVLWADRGEGERIWENILRDGSWFGETETRRRDGTIFPIQLALSIVTAGSGKPLYLMCSGIDITERKLAEQELRVRNMAIASSQSGFAITDLDGRLTYTNQAFVSIWGYASTSDMIGKSVIELWQDEEEAAAILKAIRETGRYTGERVGKRRDGAIFHAIFSGNLVTDETGAPICLAASLTDITDLKRAEAEIQIRNRELSILNRIIGISTSAVDINEMLEKVLATTLDLFSLHGGGIYLVEPDGRSARLASTRGLPEGFPLEPYIPDITIPPYAGVLVAGETCLFDGYPGEVGKTPNPYASAPITAHGKIIGALNVVFWRDRELADADHSLLAAIGREIGTSIERMLLIRQLEAAEQEANLYLDILSHDIRNAENISGLYTDLLIDMLDGETKDHAQKIRSSIRKSIEILRNVSTIRRIHHETTTPALVDLDRVIRDEIRIFSGSRIHYSGTNIVVMADPLLPEIFTNLIGNAVKFGGSAVEVTIRVEESDGDVQVSVEDTGPGVPDEAKKAIFTRFRRNRSQRSGQGLGLSITRMLVERYGGRIHVDDRVPGRPECGAAFRFTLKRAP